MRTVAPEQALHYLRSRLVEQPGYKIGLSNGRPRMTPWENLSTQEQNEQIAAMAELLEWLE